MEARTGPRSASELSPHRDHQRFTCSRSSSRCRDAHLSTVPPSSRTSSELVQLCGSTSRKAISQKAPSGASAYREGGYRTGSMANSVSSSGSASISTHDPRTLTALTRSPCATRGETKTLTSAQGSCPLGPTNLLRIPSMLTSSPSHCAASFAMTPCKPLPSKLRNAPTAPCGSRPRQGSKYFSNVSNPDPLQLSPTWLVRGTRSSPVSWIVGRSSEIRRCRRATPVSVLATSRLVCHLPSWVGRSSLGRTCVKKSSVSAKQSKSLWNTRPPGESFAGLVAARLVSISI